MDRRKRNCQAPVLDTPIRTSNMNFDHVPASTVRFWAMIDSAVVSLAFPVTAHWFLGAMYFFNGLLGFEDTAPSFDALQMFFVNLSGLMVGVWVIARLIHPVGTMAWIDGWGRVAVSALLVWTVLAASGPPVLWFFVFTELLGAGAQIYACRTRTASR